ncbi:MAG: hypothetical protein IJ795_02500 [Bacteroidales bacterium]|nr:hypothetical protein [Bacteroidales bacterium]
MKTCVLAGIGLVLVLPALLSCSKVTQQQGAEERQENQEETLKQDKMKITIDGITLPVTLADNDAVKALVSALEESSITYTASDYGGFEKVGPLGLSLPASDTRITTSAGDVILYSGNQIVLFHGSNSWSYTRIGKIEFSTLDELKSFLKAGEGDIKVTLSL